MFKAYYVKAKGEQLPYTHKLIRLAEEGNLYKLMNDEQRDFLDIISKSFTKFSGCSKSG